MKISFLLVAAVLLIPFAAYAWPPTFGAEFIFTNDEIREADQRHDGFPKIRLRKELAEKIVTLCAQRTSFADHCNVINDGFTVRVAYSNGFWFEITTDEQVLEVQTKPSTFDEFHALRERLQRDLFDVAHQVGLQPDIFASGGHIHIGIKEAFGNDGRLLRNFFVDFANHPEIADGVLDLNYLNAPPLSAHSERVRDNLRKVLEEFDSSNDQSITNFARLINKKVYTEAIAPRVFVMPDKYQALNLRHKETIEIRSIRAQLDMDEFLKELKLFESRIAYVKKLTKDGANIKYLGLSGNMKDKAMVDAFYRYVRESGLDWNEYKTLMPKPLRRKQVSPECIRSFEMLVER